MKLENCLLAGVLFATCVIIGQASYAAPAISLSSAGGPPTTNITVTGTGFAGGSVVDVYFDTTHFCLTIASGTGAANCTIKVPKDAPPQTHWITAVQRNTATGVQKPFVVRTDWRQFHGLTAAHTGYNPYENTLNKKNVADLELLWRVPAAGTYSTPVVRAGRVYIGALDGKLYAFTTQTGAAVPGFPKTLGGSVRYSSPALGHGNVYVATGGGDNKLYAFNAETGAPIAGFPISLGGEILASPTLYGGNVYVACLDGKVYAFNAVTGAAIPGFPVIPAYGGRLLGSISAAQDRIFVGSDSDTFYAFDAKTGAARGAWAGTGHNIFSTAAISGGRIFFTSTNGGLRGLSIHDGGALPGFPLTVPGAYASSPAIGQGHLVVGSFDKRVYSYSPATGDLQWSTPLNNSVDSSPFIANGVVYVSSINAPGGVYALDASTGAILWRAPVPTYGWASPVVADGIVFAASIDGHLYAFSVDGVAPSARLKGGARGVRPALSSLKPDRLVRPTRS